MGEVSYSIREYKYGRKEFKVLCMMSHVLCLSQVSSICSSRSCCADYRISRPRHFCALLELEVECCSVVINVQVVLK